MPTKSPDPKPTSSKRTILWTALLLAFLAGLAWKFDVYLMLRLRMIADEAFAGGRETPAMSSEAVAELNAYSPQRLIRGLSIRSDRVREIVFLTLVHRREKFTPGAWAGVLPALLDAFRDSPSRELKIRAWQAIGVVPEIRADDVAPIFHFVDAHLTDEERWWEVCAYLLAAVILDQPDSRPQSLERFDRALSVIDSADLQDSLRRLGEVAPDSPEAAATAKALTLKAEPRWRVLFRTILERQPALVDDLVDGSTSQQRAVFIAAFEALNARTSPSWLPPARLDHMKAKAMRVIADAAVDLRDFIAAARFLSRFSDSAEELFAVALKSKGRRRAEALTWSYAAAGPETPLGERFLEAHLATFLDALLDDDPWVRQSVLNAFAPFLTALHLESNWLKRHRTGVDAPLVAAFRRLLEKYPGRYDLQCLTVLIDAASDLDPRDVDRAAAALEREVLEMQINYDRTQIKPQGELAPVHRLLFDRLAKHRDRPSVRRAIDLRRKLEAEGILSSGRRP